MAFQKEADFERALIQVLMTKGWENAVLQHPTEQDLIQNWAKILFDNNRGIDRLGDYPLTESEMQQILEQITQLRTPLKLNGFINGKTVSIKRDNPDDKAHYGKEISLKIYDRMEIAAGQSRYQIVQQPVFPSKSKMLNDRRGDLMLLINGMPVFHLELKRSGIPVSQACNQIEKYAREGVFTGLFSLVQIFVAMNPEETRYFANPGPDGKFNPDYYFHWADFNNEPMNDWHSVASSLLSIPMAHQLIGFYTVADDADGVLKVMRSYQYYAASAISDMVSKTQWDSGKQRGGYVWHTTGSGKTMTSFKSAQLIANSNDADKVVFLTDRIELGTQSLKEYRAFADENESVQATENTYVLLSKLKSSASADTLIVTSIQKMSNIQNEEGGRNARDIALINKKRIVFIVDEAHYLPNAQYQTDEHRTKVVEDIRDNWLTLSHNGKFHAIFATSSIPEAIEYYRLMKHMMPGLKITCLVDPNIDNKGNGDDDDNGLDSGKSNAIFKEIGLLEILCDYNARYGQDFSLKTHDRFKKDVALRLAHKEQYKRIEREPEKQLDLLIVVDQMLTGFDSKWVNTLYMDKVLVYENIIQAFSRTNRLFGPDKPFGVIRYYRRPHTMEQNVMNAFKLYSGERPYGLFVDKLAHNLKKLNEVYADIAALFEHAGVPDFEKLPREKSVQAKFASLFRELNGYLESARIQGFKWEQQVYTCTDEDTGESVEIEMLFDENTFLILAQRYKELAGGESVELVDGEVPYDLVGYLTEIDTGMIDANYMNSRFEKYLKLIHQDGVPGELLEQAKEELHKTFAALTQEEQKFANIFLHDIERGDVVPESGKTLRDYITEYQTRAKNDQIHRFAQTFGLDEEKLRYMMSLGLAEGNINEFGRLDELSRTIDKAKAKAFFEAKEGVKLIPPKVNMKMDQLLRLFIISGGFEVDIP